MGEAKVLDVTDDCGNNFRHHSRQFVGSTLKIEYDHDHKSTVVSLSRIYLVPTILDCHCLERVSRTLQMSRDRQAPSLQTSLRDDFQRARNFLFPVPG